MREFMINMGILVGVYSLCFVFGPPIVYMFARAFSAGVEKGRSLVISKEKEERNE